MSRRRDTSKIWRLLREQGIEASILGEEAAQRGFISPPPPPLSQRILLGILDFVRILLLIPVYLPIVIGGGIGGDAGMGFAILLEALCVLLTIYGYFSIAYYFPSLEVLMPWFVVPQGEAGLFLLWRLIFIGAAISLIIASIVTLWTRFDPIIMSPLVMFSIIFIASINFKAMNWQLLKQLTAACYALNVLAIIAIYAERRGLGGSNFWKHM